MRRVTMSGTNRRRRLRKLTVAAATAAVAATLMVAYDASAAEFVRLGTRKLTVSVSKPAIDNRLWPVDASASALTVRYTFDDGVSGSVAALGGGPSLRASTAAGGVLTSERHGSGLAVRFP